MGAPRPAIKALPDTATPPAAVLGSRGRPGALRKVRAYLFRFAAGGIGVAAIVCGEIAEA